MHGVDLVSQWSEVSMKTATGSVEECTGSLTVCFGRQGMAWQRGAELEQCSLLS